jgi:hypothetical protein
MFSCPLRMILIQKRGFFGFYGVNRRSRALKLAIPCQVGAAECSNCPAQA